MQQKCWAAVYFPTFAVLLRETSFTVHKMGACSSFYSYRRNSHLTIIPLLTSSALVIPLFLCFPNKKSLTLVRDFPIAADAAIAYFWIVATAPAPTVRPPSRIAKRVPSSIAIGEIISTVTVMLSPGITISVPSGRLMIPVTSVVRK